MLRKILKENSEAEEFYIKKTCTLIIWIFIFEMHHSQVFKHHLSFHVVLYKEKTCIYTFLYFIFQHLSQSFKILHCQEFGKERSHLIKYLRK